MTPARTCKDYEGLLKEAKKQRNATEKKLHEDEKKVEVLEEICAAFKGLKKTEEEYLISKGKKPKPYPSWYFYPGKDTTAYYYAQDISGNSIKEAKDFKPHLYHSCGTCNQQIPVMVSYEQTYDSPEGDLWTTRAFIICCDKIQVLKEKTHT